MASHGWKTQKFPITPDMERPEVTAIFSNGPRALAQVAYAAFQEYLGLRKKKTPIGSMGMAYLQWQISRQIYQIYQSHGSVLRNHQPILRGSFWFCCSFNTGPSCFFPQRTRSDVFTDCIEYAAPIVVMIISWEMWHWGRPRHLGFPWFCGKNLLEWPRNSTPCELLPASLLEFLSAKRNVHFKFVHAAHYLEEIQEMLLGLIRKREEIPN